MASTPLKCLLHANDSWMAGQCKSQKLCAYKSKFRKYFMNSSRFISSNCFEPWLVDWLGLFFISTVLLFWLLQLQKVLQLNLEQNGEYLRRILEDQHKAGVALPSLMGSHSNPQPIPLSSSDGASSPKQYDFEVDCFPSLLSKHKASHTTESEQPRCHKKPRRSSSVEIICIDSPAESVEGW